MPANFLGHLQSICRAWLHRCARKIWPRTKASRLFAFTLRVGWTPTRSTSRTICLCEEWQQHIAKIFGHMVRTKQAERVGEVDHLRD